MIPVTITPNSINILLDGRMRTVQKDHLNFDAVKQALRDLHTYVGFDSTIEKVKEELRRLLDIPSFVAHVTEGRVQIGDGEVRFDGQPVQGVIASRLLATLQEGLDVRPLARFLDRISNNPIQTARDEIYLWLESGNLPITADGCFLAFKKVHSDYSSSHPNPDGSKFFNFVGTTVVMPGGREAVDVNRHNTCSTGLHFCSFQYLPAFGLGGESKVVILKIAPEDVVSIPTDYNHSKGRAWKYTIIGEVPEAECEHVFAKAPVVDNWGLYDGRDDDENDDFGWLDETDEEAVDSELEDYDDDADSETCGCGDVCEATDPDCPLIDDEPEQSEPEVLVFRHGKRSFDADDVAQLVEDYGQRGVAKLIKVPRTTLQGWLKQIEAAKA